MSGKEKTKTNKRQARNKKDQSMIVLMAPKKPPKTLLPKIPVLTTTAENMTMHC